jgi:polyphosphate kinase 2 (PPK2 family)
MEKSDYEAELEFLQIELAKLQRWVKQNGERIVVVFEG